MRITVGRTSTTQRLAPEPMCGATTARQFLLGHRWRRRSNRLLPAAPCTSSQRWESETEDNETTRLALGPIAVPELRAHASPGNPASVQVVTQQCLVRRCGGRKQKNCGTR